VTLAEARAIAGEWRSQIDKGIDPRAVEAEARAKPAEARKKEAHERALLIKR